MSIPEIFDTPTRKALLDAADALALAARLAVERAADVPRVDPIGRALAIFDVLSNARKEVLSI